MQTTGYSIFRSPQAISAQGYLAAIGYSISPYFSSRTFSCNPDGMVFNPSNAFDFHRFYFHFSYW